MPGSVPHDVLQHLALTYCGLKALLGLVSATILSRFPLSEADHQRRLEELAQTASRALPLPASEPELAIT